MANVSSVAIKSGLHQPWIRGVPALSSTFRTYATTSKEKQETDKESERSTSLFGSLTPNVSVDDTMVPEKKGDKEATESAMEDQIHYVEPEKDDKLQEFLAGKPYKTVNSLLSPLKRRLFLDNVKQNGFFKNGDVVELPDGTSYKLKLSREEIEALEPSIYLRSWRIKSSVKKTNIVLRALKDLPLKKAITQLQFMQKKVARDLTEMLERGMKDAETMKYDVNKIYIDQAWCHTDGRWKKRLDCRARGRTGIITHKWISVRLLLKTDQTQKRLAYEDKQRKLNKQPIVELNGGKMVGPCTGFYKW